MVTVSPTERVGRRIKTSFRRICLDLEMKKPSIATRHLFVVLISLQAAS
jgi:hypothetical protein